MSEKAKKRDYRDEIEMEALSLLVRCTDDYASRIWEKIADDVVSDVMECSGIEDDGEFSSGDVALAIGRAILEALGGEV